MSLITCPNCKKTFSYPSIVPVVPSVDWTKHDKASWETELPAAEKAGCFVLVWPDLYDWNDSLTDLLAQPKIGCSIHGIQTQPYTFSQKPIGIQVAWIPKGSLAKIQAFIQGFPEMRIITTVKEGMQAQESLLQYVPTKHLGLGPWPPVKNAVLDQRIRDILA